MMSRYCISSISYNMYSCKTHDNYFFELLGNSNRRWCRIFFILCIYYLWIFHLHLLHQETFMIFNVALKGSQAAGESLKMEMSQMGFSAAFAPSVIQIINKTIFKKQLYSCVWSYAWLIICALHIFSFKFQTEAWNAEVAAVGINQWKGGYGRYKSSGEKISSYEPDFMEPDSYLGRNMIKTTH